MIKNIAIIGGRAGLKLAASILADGNIDRSYSYDYVYNSVPINLDLEISDNKIIDKSRMYSQLDAICNELRGEADENSIHGYFIGVGDNVTRQLIHSYIKGKTDIDPVNCIHSKAIIDTDMSNIGVGNLILPGAVINIDSKIGDCNIINTNSVIEHDCVVGNYCQIAPGAILAGYCTLCDNVNVWSNATISPHCYIGENTVIGAGSVLLHTAVSNGLYVGSPAINKKS